ncbi:DUF7835 family putative zinc beta-ribbon protein [Halococcoides cellulosivorans]|uniref:DUF7835 domain-containing protein n=1 Tax=Halococcoides cellulosivorans TaxID=1679096 RepID=A0A2R4WYJ9_9EURY|nr:hypothetical protein HARCEL1_02225 [Halococcoides cellulosivorans]
MATSDRRGTSLTEHCPSCADRTSHVVSVEIVTENDESSNAAFSREPYRVTQCERCGTQTKTRMNDA